MKLVIDEPESAGLEAWLGSQPEPVLVSSVLARTEVVRAVARTDPNAAQLAVDMLAAAGRHGVAVAHPGWPPPGAKRLTTALAPSPEHGASARSMRPLHSGFVPDRFVHFGHYVIGAEQQVPIEGPGEPAVVGHRYDGAGELLQSGLPGLI
jgi:hypothetical protein